MQFGVTRALIGNYVRHDNGPASVSDVKAPWYSLDYTFAMEQGEAKLPRAPISGKSMSDKAEAVAAE